MHFRRLYDFAFCLNKKSTSVPGIFCALSNEDYVSEKTARRRSKNAILELEGAPVLVRHTKSVTSA